ncbi:MAG TPA: arginine deiminase-related protein [Bryobacteraceae bacterium]|nr:arginine deiminase-related protein [Bryobacteraceae bacterium]
MTDRFLMCRPQYFEVRYIINPWMAGNVHCVSQPDADEQWTTLHRLMRDGAHVELIEPEPNLPDMPFTANAGLVVGNTVLLSNFRYAERQTEEKHFERWFRDHGFAVHKLPREISFEGAGDALLDRARSCIWMGYGHRSELAAGGHIEKLFGLEVIPLELTDPRFYHLDTCFCPLPGGSVMYYRNAFSPASQALLRSRIPVESAILVDEKDALKFACNAVSMGGKVILNSASDDLRNRLSQTGLRAELSPLSEFLRAGGASKCLTLRLEEPV